MKIAKCKLQIEPPLAHSPIGNLHFAFFTLQSLGARSLAVLGIADRGSGIPVHGPDFLPFRLPSAALACRRSLTQLTLMRELLSAFCGNELVVGIVLGAWMLLTGVGATLGRTASRLRSPIVAFVAAEDSHRIAADRRRVPVPRAAERGVPPRCRGGQSPKPRQAASCCWRPIAWSPATC